MKRDTELLRQWLLGALAIADRPISTMELADAAPRKRERWERRCDRDKHPHGGFAVSHFDIVECVPGWHVVDVNRSNHDIYVQMRALEKQGLAAHDKVEGICHWSRAYPADTVEEIANLERMWSL